MPIIITIISLGIAYKSLCIVLDYAPPSYVIRFSALSVGVTKIIFLPIDLKMSIVDLIIVTSPTPGPPAITLNLEKIADFIVEILNIFHSLLKLKFEINETL